MSNSNSNPCVDFCSTCGFGIDLPGICENCENEAEMQLAGDDAEFDKLASEVGLDEAVRIYYA